MTVQFVDEKDVAQARTTGAVSIVDLFDEQFQELCEIQRLKLGAAFDYQRLTSTVGAGQWVHFPWRNTILRILGEPYFSDVRLSRNSGKITALERDCLATKTVAVVGLSVGAAIAEVCAREGVGRTFRLADHDRISLSNLNRLFGGVHDLGTKKVDACARRLYELDPYLSVERFDAGVVDTNIEEFLRGADVVLEECDSLYVKLKVREVARSLRIPVVMETTDRGMLDVERFDLEPSRPILHGLLGSRSANEARDLSLPHRVQIVKEILGVGLSARMHTAMDEVGKTLVSWPQLASDVALGASRATVAVRSILLGESVPSGRSFAPVS
jgi:molybdopterin/thiamine biosynthesis adenylyltransferase